MIAAPSHSTAARSAPGRSRLATVLLLALLLAVASACGKRGDPVAPDPERQDSFPAIYPSPSTFPR